MVNQNAELEKSLRENRFQVFPPPNIGTVSDLDNLKIVETFAAEFDSDFEIIGNVFEHPHLWQKGWKNK